MGDWRNDPNRVIRHNLGLSKHLQTAWHQRTGTLVVGDRVRLFGASQEGVVTAFHHARLYKKLRRVEATVQWDSGEIANLPLGKLRRV